MDIAGKERTHTPGTHHGSVETPACQHGAGKENQRPNTEDAQALSSLRSTNDLATRGALTELEQEQNRMRDLEVEWGQLQLEQSTWAAHARVEKIARDKLGMKPPQPSRVVSLEK